MIKRTTYLAAMIAFFFSSAWAGNNLTVNNEKKATDPDTVSFDLEIEEIEDEDGNIVDVSSLAKYSIPAYTIYDIWDTVTINPYKLDVTKTFDPTTLVLKDEFNCGYVHPISGLVTSKYGKRRNRFHAGIDIDLETGDSVRSAFEGTVRVARVASGYGNVIVIRHHNGLETLYGHLSRIDVQIGQHVEAGQLIGLGGNTGRSTGSHLHFEVRFKGAAMDPANLISFNSNQLLCDTIEINNHTFKTYTTYKADALRARYYKVRKGDTLSRIAKRHGTTTKKLCRLNGIKPTTTLRIGRTLRTS